MCTHADTHYSHGWLAHTLLVLLSSIFSLYLESPSGVGFSTSKTHSDYKTGDAQTAQDTLDFLLLFFAEFSEFAKRDFYISGESYGGHYTVNAAREIVMHNEATQDTTVNIKGVIVGNAWTDAALDNQGSSMTLPHTHTHTHIHTYTHTHRYTRSHTRTDTHAHIHAHIHSLTHSLTFYISPSSL